MEDEDDHDDHDVIDQPVVPPKKQSRTVYDFTERQKRREDKRIAKEQRLIEREEKRIARRARAVVRNRQRR